jgi:hypothetical protein
VLGGGTRTSPSPHRAAFRRCARPCPSLLCALPSAGCSAVSSMELALDTCTCSRGAHRRRIRVSRLTSPLQPAWSPPLPRPHLRQALVYRRHQLCTRSLTNSAQLPSLVCTLSAWPLHSPPPRFFPLSLLHLPAAGFRKFPHPKGQTKKLLSMPRGT